LSGQDIGPEALRKGLNSVEFEINQLAEYRNDMIELEKRWEREKEEIQKIYEQIGADKSEQVVMNIGDVKFHKPDEQGIAGVTPRKRLVFDESVLGFQKSYNEAIGGTGKRKLKEDGLKGKNTKAAIKEVMAFGGDLENFRKNILKPMPDKQDKLVPSVVNEKERAKDIMVEKLQKKFPRLALKYVPELVAVLREIAEKEFDKAVNIWNPDIVIQKLDSVFDKFISDISSEDVKQFIQFK